MTLAEAAGPRVHRASWKFNFFEVTALQREGWQQGGLREFISKHLFERSLFYEKAQIKINVDNKSIPEIIGEILLSLD